MPYQIRVNCTCGKILRVPEQYAGKRGKCPSCGRKITIPAMDEIQPKTTPAAKEEQEVRHCPTCGAFLNPGDTMCVSCHTNLATGEWDMEGKTAASRAAEKPSSWPLVLASCGVVVILLVVGVLIFHNPETNNSLVPDKTSQSLPPIPAENNPANQLASDMKKVLEMADNTTEAVEQKLQEFETLLDKSLKLAAMKEYQLLIQKKKASQLAKAYQAISGQQNLSAITRWLKLKELKGQYPDVSYAKLDEEFQEADKQLVAQARENTQAAQELLAGQKYSQLFNQTVKWFAEVMQAPYGENVTQELTAHSQVAREAVERAWPENGQPAPVAKTTDESALLALKTKVNEALSNHRDLQANWEFEKANSLFTPLGEEAMALQKKFPEDPELPKFVFLYQEARLLDKFWQTVTRSAKTLEKKDFTFFFRKKSKPAIGNVTQVQDGKISLLDSKTNQTEVIALTDLSPALLGKIALLNAKESADLYASLAAFYYLTGEYAECKEICHKATKAGMTSKMLETYQKHAESAIEDEKKALEERAKHKDEEVKKITEGYEQTKGERVKRDGWRIIDRLVGEYKRGNNDRVFTYLGELKDLVPRDELIKMSSALKKKEGQSLVKIAETIFDHCNFCKNEGTLKCSNCRGEGIITENPRIIGQTPLKEKKYVCPVCKGKGEVECEICYEKRHNRNYIMLVDYYKGF